MHGRANYGKQSNDENAIDDSCYHVFLDYVDTDGYKGMISPTDLRTQAVMDPFVDL